MTIAIATCRKLPGLDVDEALVLAPLHERGIAVDLQIWDDPTVDWSKYEAVIMRCCWDYQDRVDEFLDWVARVPRLHNPAAVVKWNLDKTYLRELADAGVPTVPTQWLEPGEEFRQQQGRWVLKPTVGAGSRYAGVYDFPTQKELAHAHIKRLHDSDKTVMAQPFLDTVASHGERGLLYLGGRYSHTIVKSAMINGPYRDDVGLFKEENIGSAQATGEEKAVAQAALAAVPVADPSALLYARVDLVETERGPAVLELELAEPSLYYAHGPGSEVRMAEAISTLLT